MSDTRISPAVLVTRQEGWMTITLNQPEKRNPLTGEVIAEISVVLTEVQDDRSVRGITFTGAGGVFCAGGDLKAFQQIMAGGDEAEAIAQKTSLEAATFFWIDRPSTAGDRGSGGWCCDGRWSWDGVCLRFCAGYAGGEICFHRNAAWPAARADCTIRNQASRLSKGQENACLGKQADWRRGLPYWSGG